MSNRLLGITQENTRSKGNRTTAHSSTAITYGLDAAGNLTHDGLRQLRYGADNHLSAVRIHKDGEEAQVTYLNNTLGQRVFKSEPQASQTRPQAQNLGQDFIAWLKKNFAWLFEPAQRSASLGTSYTWASGPMPAWALLGQYDNGSAKGKGRSEYLWLPIETGAFDTDARTLLQPTDSLTPTAIPIGLIRNNRRYALHSDHLGSVRRLSDEAGQTQWQWPYSAFGANPPSGPLKATPKPDKAMTGAPQRLKATSPKLELDLRYPGQTAEEHSALHDNWHRQYQPLLGRYTQADPIGLAGGWNRFAYGEGNPVSLTDPLGLWAWGDPLPQDAVNACAGFGDGISLGVTAGIRQALGTNDAVDFLSPEYLGGVSVGVAFTTRGYATGAELSIGRNFRIAPWGNRTGHPTGRYPHYHRRGGPLDVNGNPPPGQSIKRHRPWDSRSTDRDGWDRF